MVAQVDCQDCRAVQLFLSLKVLCASGCYTACIGNPLWIWDKIDGQEAPCDSIGLIPVANSYVLPPEGIAFDGEGMLGQAWMDTPLGVFDDASRQSRHWSLILDTKNFKGPVAYYLPEFWSVTGKWTNYDGKKYPTEDFSKTGLSSSMYAFEIHSPPAFREQTADGEVFLKIPKMQMGRNMGDKTVLMGGFKSWHDKKDLYTTVDSLMSGTSPGKSFQT